MYFVYLYGKLLKIVKEYDGAFLESLYFSEKLIPIHAKG